MSALRGWLTGLLLVGILSAGLSCRERATPMLPEVPDYSPGHDEFSVMTWNVEHYSLMDRDGDGRENDPKPEKARKALIAVISRLRPDILVVQEMGAPPMFKEFSFALKEAGLDYPHVEYLRRGTHENNMAVLSRFPIISRQSHTDDRYSMGDAKLPVSRGIIDIDIQVAPDYIFRLFVAHLKSRVHHPLGQTEMRRNEARLLNKHVRAALKDFPGRNILVVGDLNDTYQSAALKEVLGKRTRVLFDLRPEDNYGEVWSQFSAALDTYSRIDYALVSRGMWPEVVREKCAVIRDKDVLEASDHRPLYVVFHARDLAPDLTVKD